MEKKGKEKIMEKKHNKNKKRKEKWSDSVPAGRVQGSFSLTNS